MHTATLSLLLFLSAFAGSPQTAAPAQKVVWKPVQFAIVRFNGEAPQAWNIYHFEKRLSVIVKLWKRYLLVDPKEGEVYELDPQTITPQGENIAWALADLPSDPIEITEWKARDVGLVRSIKFRFGKAGHTLEIQIPIKPDGKPAY
jgi:hypothetical protein